MGVIDSDRSGEILEVGGGGIFYYIWTTCKLEYYRGGGMYIILW